MDHVTTPLELYGQLHGLDADTAPLFTSDKSASWIAFVQVTSCCLTENVAFSLLCFVFSFVIDDCQFLDREVNSSKRAGRQTSQDTSEAAEFDNHNTDKDHENSVKKKTSWPVIIADMRQTRRWHFMTLFEYLPCASYLKLSKGRVFSHQTIYLVNSMQLCSLILEFQRWMQAHCYSYLSLHLAS